MSDYKSNPQTLDYIPTGAILKWEATHLTRVAVTAPKNTRAGQLVDYPLRGKKLVALTDENDGKVLVQPYNCIISLDYISASEVAAALGDSKTVEDLKTEGDVYGIQYVGTAKA